ncbi:MAG TPA: thioredoxin domain-containing protein, partial [Pyrinomonadaceae bacterium]|nr:thioredoxin domain-containing protein [Pyrinomonadaceae bacterium]
MKFFSTLFCLLFLTFSLFAQKTDEVLATANGQNYTVKNLSPEAAQEWLNQAKTIAEVRSNLLSQLVAEKLFEAEGKVRNVPSKQIRAEAMAKIPAPSTAQIQEIYDANQNVFAGKPLDEVKPQIVAYLRREPEQKALQELVDSLKTKHKVSFGKDVNAPDLKPLEVLATVGTKTISAQEFDEEYKLNLYEFRANIFDAVKDNLEDAIYSDLVVAEAKARNIEASDLIAAEISDKLKDFSDEERFNLQSALMKMLFAKYKVNFLIKEPAPIVQNISVDDDPSKGSATAPVTVVMFSDFQCPACSATHPILKKVLAEFPAEKIRFVVRDYPLEFIHNNAFQAALAANAAFKQGKFFEYTEILYNNQNALDAASLKKYAANLGLNLPKFEADMNDANIASEVRKDIEDGDNYGVSSTPTIFINGIKIRRNTAESFR